MPKKKKDVAFSADDLKNLSNEVVATILARALAATKSDKDCWGFVLATMALVCADLIANLNRDNSDKTIERLALTIRGCVALTPKQPDPFLH